MDRLLEKLGKTKINWNRVLIYCISLVLSVLYIYGAHSIVAGGLVLSENDDGVRQSYLKARVVEITDRQEIPLEWDPTGEQMNIEITGKAEILSGHEKGQITEISQTITPLIPIEIKEVAPGDKILITESQDNNGELIWTFVEYIRIDTLILFGVIFILLLIVFGRWKGFNTIVSMMFTCLAIFYVLVPAILSGHNAYLWAVTTCFFIIIMTMLIIYGGTEYGGNKKSLAAGIGCVGGVLVAGILTLLYNSITQLTGFTSENAIYIVGMNSENPIDLRGLVFCTILIGSLGAIMDVAVDISSALNELADNVEKPTFSMITKSGMRIGTDVMGTMANTLVLAYIGCSLSTVLLLVAYNNSYLNLFNSEMIIVEILQALAGSFGILFTIPATSMICGVLYGNIEKKAIPDHSLALEEDKGH